MLTQERRTTEGIEWLNLKDGIATRITFNKCSVSNFMLKFSRMMFGTDSQLK